MNKFGQLTAFGRGVTSWYLVRFVDRRLDFLEVVEAEDVAVLPVFFTHFFWLQVTGVHADNASFPTIPIRLLYLCAVSSDDTNPGQ